MNISIKLEGIKEVQGYFKALATGQLPFAMRRATYQMAMRVKEDLVQRMKQDFDKPTPYTLKGVYTLPANKEKTSFEIGLKGKWETSKGGDAAAYLAPHIYSGDRGFKASERAMQRVGILPPGYYVVPGEGLRLNQYGNIPGPQMVRILAELKAHGEVGYAANMTARSRQRNPNYRERTLFVVHPGRGSYLPPGVWQRTKRGIKPLLMFVKTPRYRTRYPFHDYAQRTIDREWRDIYGAAVQYALATAR